MREPHGHRLDFVDLVNLVQGPFAVLLPIVAAIFLVVGAVLASLYLLITHPAFTLLPFVALGVGAWLFARWDQWSHRPPGL